MIRQSVFSEGIEYVLLCKPTGPAKRCWAWVDAVTRCRVEDTDITMLRDAFLSQKTRSTDKPMTPHERERLFEVLLSMGAPQEQVVSRLGIHRPRRCLDCGKTTTDGYAGPRCTACYEQYIRTSGPKYAVGAEFPGGGPQAR